MIQSNSDHASEDDGSTATKKRPRATDAGEGLVVTIPSMGGGFSYFLYRYYTHYLARDVRGVPGHNLRLLRHTNGMSVVCLDPSHALLQLRGDGTRRGIIASFDVKRSRCSGETKNRAADTERIKGKSKKQAIWTQPETILVGLDWADSPAALAPPQPNSGGNEEEGSVAAAPRPWYPKRQPFEFRVPALINGSLLEVNAALVGDPSLLWRAPLTLGYIAVLNPKVSETWSNFEVVSRPEQPPLLIAEDGDVE